MPPKAGVPLDPIDIGRIRDAVAPDHGGGRVPAEGSGTGREPMTVTMARAMPGGQAHMPNNVRIAVIDEHSFTRECIALSLQEVDRGLSIVPFASFATFRRSDISFDLVIYHWHRNGAQQEAFQALKELATRQPVVVLSPVSRARLVLDAFEQGVRGYIPTENTTLDLAIEIIRLVRAGGTFVPVSTLAFQGVADEAAVMNVTPVHFTPREAAVLELLKQGYINRAIADQLHVSESTVKTNLRSIMRKLKVSNRTEAVWRAITAGLLTLGLIVCA